MMRGASLQDWSCLLKFKDFTESVYVLNSERMAVHLPFARFEVENSLRHLALPWNVIMLLGKYHRKHIFQKVTSLNVRWQ